MSKSISLLTDSTLPRPGLSGLAWVRETRPVPRKGTLPPVGRRNAPSRTIGSGPGDVIKSEGGGAGKAGQWPDPVSEVADLSEPNAPTTADPLHRYIEKPNERHARLYGRLPDVGGARPWQGVTTKFANGRMGGVPVLPAPVNANVEPPKPGEVRTQGTSPRGFRMRVGIARRALKRPVKLKRGLGGLDFAMGPRFVPDLPSYVREAIRNVRPGTLHGTLVGHRTAPDFVSTTLASARAGRSLTGTGVAVDHENTTAPIPSSSSTNPPLGINLKFGTGIAVNPEAEDRPQAAPVPVAPTGAGGGMGLLLVAAVAFLVLSHAG